VFKIGKVLVPTRLSQSSAFPLRVAASFSAAFGSSVDLLYVVDQGHQLTWDPIEERFRELLRCVPKDTLAQIKLRLSRGELVERIIETANEGYDLVLLEQPEPSDSPEHTALMRAISAGAGCPVISVCDRDALSAFELMDLLLLRLCLRPLAGTRSRANGVSDEPEYASRGRHA
jgi:hypothetical protein